MTISFLRFWDDFFSAVLPADSRVAWRAACAAIFGSSITPEQADLIKECTGRTFTTPGELAREVWFICGRRSGKSQIAALIAIYLACFSEYRTAPGEKLVGMLLAADRRQAKVLKGYISGLMHAAPVLEEMIVSETQLSITLTNGIVIEVHTSNFRNVRGYTIAFALCDEIAFWPSEDAANPDGEVLTALRPAMATVPGAMLIALSSPYAQKGELYRAFRDHYGRDGDVLVWKAPSRTMNPTVPQAVIDKAYADDPASAAAEYGAEFRTDVSALFERPVLESCVGSHRERPAVPGMTYRAFVDPAGGSGSDSMTLAVAHTEGAMQILDLVREWRPKFSPEDVVVECVGILKPYGISEVVGDRFGGAGDDHSAAGPDRAGLHEGALRHAL